MNDSDKHLVEETRSLSHFKFKNFCYGAIAGATAKTVIAPLERAKIIIQVSSEKFSYNRYANILYNTYCQKGVRELWRGHSATLLRILPYSGTLFFVHEAAKKILDVENSKESNSVGKKRFLAGCAAGSASVLATYPLDLMRARMAVTDRQRYRSFYDVFRKIIFEEGFFRLYKGFLPTLIGINLYAGVSFSTYETLCDYYKTHENTRKSFPTESIYFGCIAGLLGQTSSYPIDIIRRTLQTDGAHDLRYKFSGVNSIISHNFVNKGVIQGFYRGLSINFFKGPLASSLSFTVFNYLKTNF